MQQIINFLIQKKTFVTFLLLFGISISLVAYTHTYQHSKFFNSANWISGKIYSAKHSIGQYFDLKKQNEMLVYENNYLRKIISNTESHFADSIVKIDSIKKYNYKKATVIKNSFNKQQNYLLINKGENDSLKQDMGVITSKGIVGIIEDTSNNYANIQSILNTLSEINASIKNTRNFGSLKWNGDDINIVQLEDVLHSASIKKGDTIITGGMSSIFPEGILIGSIINFSLDNSENYYTIDVELFNNMTNLNHVYVIENIHANEIITLQNKINE